MALSANNSGGKKPLFALRPPAPGEPSWKEIWEKGTRFGPPAEAMQPVSHPGKANGPAAGPRIHGHSQPSLNRVAFSATVHCLTGCSIGEVLGMVLGSALGWGNWTTVAVSVGLAFGFGYGLTMLPLLRSAIPFRTALRLALAADTVSIALMEAIDNAVMLVIPGAMEAGLTSPLFWGSLLFSLLLAGVAAFPVNRWLIVRGRGHAVPGGRHSHHE